MTNKDLIETLYAGRSWEVEAAALIERLEFKIRCLEADQVCTATELSEANKLIDQLKKENEELRADLKQLNEDYSGGLLVAHNGVSSMRAELETVTKQRVELLEFCKDTIKMLQWNTDDYCDSV